MGIHYVLQKQGAYCNVRTGPSIPFSKGMGTLSGEATLPKLFYVTSEKEPTLKGKNLLPRGENSFLLEKTPFQERGKTFL